MSFASLSLTGKDGRGSVVGFAQKVRNATNGSWCIIKVHPTLVDAAQKLRAKRAEKENSLGIAVKE